MLCLFIASQSAFSQSMQSGIGITSGYFIAHNDVLFAYHCCPCKLMDNFNKGNYFEGLTYEFAFNMGIEGSIITKLYYNSFSFFNTKVQDDYAVLEPDPNNPGQQKLVRSLTQWEWSGKYSLLSLDLMPKITIPNIKLGIFFGFSFSYLIDSKYNEIYRMVEPGNGYFTPDSTVYAKYGVRLSDDKRSIIYKEGKMPFKNDFRYGLKFGLTYDYDILGFRISPFVAVDYPLSSVINNVKLNCTPADSITPADYHWKITYLQAGIDVKYMF